MTAEITSSKFVAGEVASSENERDGDSATRSMNNAVNLTLKPGNTILPAWSCFGFVPGGGSMPKDLQKPENVYLVFQETLLPINNPWLNHEKVNMLALLATYLPCYNYHLHNVSNIEIKSKVWLQISRLLKMQYCPILAYTSYRR